MQAAVHQQQRRKGRRHSGGGGCGGRCHWNVRECAICVRVCAYVWGNTQKSQPAKAEECDHRHTHAQREACARKLSLVASPAGLPGSRRRADRTCNHAPSLSLALTEFPCSLSPLFRPPLSPLLSGMRVESRCCSRRSEREREREGCWNARKEIQSQQILDPAVIPAAAAADAGAARDGDGDDDDDDDDEKE